MSTSDIDTEATRLMVEELGRITEQATMIAEYCRSANRKERGMVYDRMAERYAQIAKAIAGDIADFTELGAVLREQYIDRTEATS